MPEGAEDRRRSLARTPSYLGKADSREYAAVEEFGG
jgi:hypothetical protein